MTPTPRLVPDRPSDDEVVGHKTLRDESGRIYHEPLTRAEADQLIRNVEEQQARRNGLMPDERAAIAMFFDAWLRLKDFGWREAIYCPKDGSSFLAIEPGCTAMLDCTYEGEWPRGSWWSYADGDCGPSHPALFKLKPALIAAAPSAERGDDPHEFGAGILPNPKARYWQERARFWREQALALGYNPEAAAPAGGECQHEWAEDGDATAGRLFCRLCKIDKPASAPAGSGEVGFDLVAVMESWHSALDSAKELAANAPDERFRKRAADVVVYLMIRAPNNDSALLRKLKQGAESFVSCTCHEERQKTLCLNKHRCVRAYPLASQGQGGGK